MKNELKISIDKMLKKDLLHFLLSNIFLILGVIFCLISSFYIGVKEKEINKYFFIFPLMLPFVFSIFMIYRYFNFFNNRNQFKNKLWIKILLINIIILGIINLSFLFWSFLIPSFLIRYKKSTNSEEQNNVLNIISILKWVIISLNIISIPIIIFNISISSYYFKNYNNQIKD